MDALLSLTRRLTICKTSHINTRSHADSYVQTKVPLIYPFLKSNLSFSSPQSTLSAMWCWCDTSLLVAVQVRFSLPLSVEFLFYLLLLMNLLNLWTKPHLWKVQAYKMHGPPKVNFDWGFMFPHVSSTKRIRPKLTNHMLF